MNLDRLRSSLGDLARAQASLESFLWSGSLSARYRQPESLDALQGELAKVLNAASEALLVAGGLAELARMEEEKRLEEAAKIVPFPRREAA